MQQAAAMFSVPVKNKCLVSTPLRVQEGPIAEVQLCRGLVEAHITSEDACVLVPLVCDLDLFVRRLLWAL